MKKLSMCGLLVVMIGVIGFGVVSAQGPKGNPDIDRLDPALDAIVPRNAKLEILKADYFGNVEGPVWVQEGQSGYLLFTDISANHIYKWSPDGTISMFLDRTGFNSANTDRLANGRICWRIQRAVLSYVVRLQRDDARSARQDCVVCTRGPVDCASGEGRQDADGLADRYEGKRLNRPNDLVAKSDGWIYFTDPHSNSRADQPGPRFQRRVPRERRHVATAGQGS